DRRGQQGGSRRRRSGRGRRAGADPPSLPDHRPVAARDLRRHRARCAGAGARRGGAPGRARMGARRQLGRVRRLVVKVGSGLVTTQDIGDRARYLNARNTLLALLRFGVLPIVNENDTVAVEEIKVGDNDNLSALVASLIEADLLVLLTDVDGLYTANPAVSGDARKLDTVEAVTDDITRLVWEGA